MLNKSPKRITTKPNIDEAVKGIFGVHYACTLGFNPGVPGEQESSVPEKSSNLSNSQKKTHTATGSHNWIHSYKHIDSMRGHCETLMKFNPQTQLRNHSLVAPGLQVVMSKTLARSHLPIQAASPIRTHEMFNGHMSHIHGACLLTRAMLHLIQQNF